MRNTMMKPLSLALSCAILAVLGTPARGAGRAQPAGKPYVYKSVGDRDLRLFVVTPPGWKAADSRPAIVFFHGGGWVSGRPIQFNEHSKYLASRGMVAVQVEYRLLDRKSKDPPTVCIQDARSAMRWVRAHARQLGVDPGRIASAGGSAGGHLAAFVGMVEGQDDPADDRSISPKSNAMVLFNPVFDNGPTGWGHQRVGDRTKEFSPFHNVTGDDPPAIVFLGSKDKLIPVKTVQDFKAAMEKAGVRCETVIYEGQAHGFFNYGRAGGKYYYETVVAADRFLASLGWLSGPPTLEKPKGP
jgi:acetyl esterase